MRHRITQHDGRRYSLKRDDLSWQALEAVARADKRRDLAALSGIWTGKADGRPRPIGLPAKAVNVLNSRPLNAPDIQVVGEPVAPHQQRWCETADALMANPAAALPDVG